MQNDENLTPEQALKKMLEKAKELADKELLESGESSKNNTWKECLEQIEKTIETIPESESADYPNPRTLHLAITMAGAISAGAYTAGVMDYLLEVLDKWSELKEKGDLRVPTHNIKIEVLSGASAGGITAAITSVALHRKDRHSIKSYNPDAEKIHSQEHIDEYSTDRRKSNRFYNSWVNLSADEMMSVLLRSGDFVNLANGRKTCVSVLNSEFVEKIANSTVHLNRDDKSSSLPDYVSDKLRLFLTLTNLDGFEKTIQFQTTDAIRSEQDFVMTDHRDAVLFRFADYSNYAKENDGSIWVKFEEDDYGTDILQKAAMATGAFPIGLAYRIFSRKLHHINDNILLKKLHGNLNLSNKDYPKVYRVAFVDGGLINNEPFELTQMLLRRIVKNDRLTKNPENFNSTILMIDPFPTERRGFLPFTEDNNFHPYGLFGAAAKFFSVLRKQVLVKHDIIEDAFNNNNYSCFVIAPSRHARQSGGLVKFNGSRAIASGPLGGFGGFVAKEFREHDFYLGRINCKSFLQSHFRIPADTNNPIFKDAFSNEAKKFFLIKDEETQEEFLPIIPDVNKLEEGISVKQLYKNLMFPAYSVSRFERLRPHLAKRIRHVFDNNVDFSALPWYLRPFVKFYVKINLKVIKWLMFRKLASAVENNFDHWELNRDSAKKPKSSD